MKCSKCGKRITDPKYLELGIGEDCLKKMNAASSADYVHARESLITNQGEDIKDSARHRYHEWKGIDDAEAQGEAYAKAAIVRDKLIKSTPPNITVSDNNIVASTFAATMLKRLPKAPTEADPKWFSGSSSLSAHGTEPKSEKIIYAACKLGKKGNEIILQITPYKPSAENWIKRYPNAYVKEFTSLEEANKALRNTYYDKFEWMKAKSEEVALAGELDKIVDLADEELKKSLQLKINKTKEEFLEEYSSKDGNNYWRLIDPADQDMLDRYYQFKTYGSPKKGSVAEVMFTTLDSIKKGDIESLKSKLNDALKGGSIGSNNVSIRGERFNPIVFYNQTLERSGPDIPEKNLEGYLDSINNKWKIRGLQFGNTVPDKERIEHLGQVCKAFHDLKFALNLDDNEISINGKLALAIGARGRSSALAHYEPDHKAINLTRKNGIGALAHEWGHGLEDILYSKEERGGMTQSLGFAPQLDSDADNLFGKRKTDLTAKNMDHKMAEAQWTFMKELRPFVERMKSSEGFKKQAPKTREYLKNDREIFARTFEAMVKHKLEKAGRKNTYLVSCSHPDFYPNSKELEKMESSFDLLLKTVLNKK